MSPEQPPAQPPVPPVELPKAPKPISPIEASLLEPGEQIVTIVHRHPIGIIIIYLETLAAIIAILAVVFLAAPSFLDNVSGQTYNLLLAGIIMVIALLSLILFVATYIYRQSRLIVSDKSLIQIIQKGLFVRKISRLSMSNVQDVSADHNGFLATIFGFGTLTVETAGEEDNFVFPYCPTPDDYSERILEARQKYIQSLDQAGRAAAGG